MCSEMSCVAAASVVPVYASVLIKLHQNIFSFSKFITTQSKLICTIQRGKKYFYVGGTKSIYFLPIVTLFIVVVIFIDTSAEATVKQIESDLNGLYDVCLNGHWFIQSVSKLFYLQISCCAWWVNISASVSSVQNTVCLATLQTQI